ncbi:BnaA02g33150D [Brassica napus]|uniref:BnaA02g33150D protein n=1 Tax=Brassica napus TaxID=3708 RepID=A0A078H1L6_BRANA|nr:BnaA02g33150D [Brassica napus]
MNILMTHTIYVATPHIYLLNNKYNETNVPNTYIYFSSLISRQHQGNLTGVNVEAPTAYPLEDISSWSFNDGTNNEEMLDTLVANLEMYLPTQDMNITNQGNNHEEMFNSLAANPEMHFPTQDMNITNQASLVSIAERFFLTLDCFHDCDDEDFMDYLIDPDMN